MKDPDATSRKLRWLAIVANGMATMGLSPQRKDYNMTKIPVRKSIAVSIQAPMKLMVLVRFSNISDGDIFVLRDPPPLFVTADGQDIPDIGPSEKRKAYTLEDYERVPAGHATERRQNIASQFEWKPSRHTYEVSVSGNYTDPTTGQSWKGRRVAAKFEWTQ